ncbi:hypothetical protein [Aliiglaciecola sp. LCG003]|uniref:hypothetical protein n=1 Tax=Aliiglaciecola sp. LCG003 TaxID=3053655 RepID=UPI0025739BC2|nr:hypothetical protein [Aliiglaciecola sp. LCG003]WJG09340.1 hypothetical protein QR722_18730 [Aliiglaciecola sp. LCG003]
MSRSEVKKYRKTPLLLAIVFVLPVVLAYLALSYDWFNKASTNKGQLLETVLDLNLINSELEPKWRLLFVMPQTCQQSCENALYSINQIWVALGKESDRVEPVVLVHNNSANPQSTQIVKHPSVVVLQVDEQNVNKVFKDDAADGIFISDTLGNIILKYPLKQQEQEAIQQSRDILSDLRKLLKLSRIG